MRRQWRSGTSLATKGDADAQFNLGQAYRLGRGVAINLAAAKDWFEKSADQGHIDAETTLGLLLFQGGEQSDGLKWLKKAAVQGEPRALLMYGTALVNGDSVTQDPVLGYAYVSRAAAQGTPAGKGNADAARSDPSTRRPQARTGDRSNARESRAAAQICTGTGRADEAGRDRGAKVDDAGRDSDHEAAETDKHGSRAATAKG